MAKLTQNTMLYDEHGELVFLFAGDEAPEWAKSQLGKHLFEKSESPKSVSESIADGETVRSAAGKLPVVEAKEEEEEKGVTQPKRGASAAAWRKYASAAGVNIEKGMTRDEIVEAVEAAGIEVE